MHNAQLKIANCKLQITSSKLTNSPAQFCAGQLFFLYRQISTNGGSFSIYNENEKEFGRILLLEMHRKRGGLKCGNITAHYLLRNKKSIQATKKKGVYYV